MAFPDLALETDAALHASAIGVPDDGEQTVNLAFRTEIIEAEKVEIEVVPLDGGSVIGASLVSLDEATGDAVIDFIQTGADRAEVKAVLNHTTPW